MGKKESQRIKEKIQRTSRTVCKRILTGVWYYLIAIVLLMPLVGYSQQTTPQSPVVTGAAMKRIAEGEMAPFDGYLLTDEALVQIMAKSESDKRECDIEKKFLEDKIRLQEKFCDKAISLAEKSPKAVAPPQKEEKKFFEKTAFAIAYGVLAIATYETGKRIIEKRLE